MRWASRDIPPEYTFRQMALQLTPQEGRMASPPAQRQGQRHFNSRPPRGGEHAMREKAPHDCRLLQLTPPRERANTARTAHPYPLQLTPRAGGERRWLLPLFCSRHFNSRPVRGEPLGALLLKRHDVALIHASCVGANYQPSGTPGRYSHFNPRPTCAERTATAKLRGTRNLLQLTPPHGGEPIGNTTPIYGPQL